MSPIGQPVDVPEPRRTEERLRAGIECLDAGIGALNVQRATLSDKIDGLVGPVELPELAVDDSPDGPGVLDSLTRSLATWQRAMVEMGRQIERL